MKRTASICALVIAFALPAAAETRYGTPVNIADTTAVSAIVDNPDGYVGREVKVEGMIVSVCARRGCWMEIASDREFEKIRIKVEDGVIVFPLSARGKKAVVQGRVEAVSMSADEAKSFYAHQAEERGTSFDPSSVEGPVTYYQIRATGAVVD